MQILTLACFPVQKKKVFIEACTQAAKFQLKHTLKKNPATNWNKISTQMFEALKLCGVLITNKPNQRKPFNRKYQIITGTGDATRSLLTPTYLHCFYLIVF